FVPAIVNLADLYRALGRDADGMLLLRQAIAIDPNNATAHHALGLAQVRIRQIDDAVASLRKASELAPENARYAYVYGIALNSAGAQGESLDVLRRAHQAHRVNFEILSALVTISRDAGDLAGAVGYAEELVRLAPRNPDARALRDSLPGN